MQALRGPGRRNDRRRRHRPRAARGRGQGLRKVERGGHGDGPGSRPRSASSPSRWSRPGCSTGRRGRPHVGASRADPGAWRPRPSGGGGERPTSCWSIPTQAARSCRPSYEPQPQTPYAARCPPRVVATFLRGRATVLDGAVVGCGMSARTSLEPAWCSSSRTAGSCGRLVARSAGTFGGAVFTTGMSGYRRRSPTPPTAARSWCRPLPHIGNYGVNDETPSRAASG